MRQNIHLHQKCDMYLDVVKVIMEDSILTRVGVYVKFSEDEHACTQLFLKTEKVKRPFMKIAHYV